MKQNSFTFNFKHYLLTILLFSSLILVFFIGASEWLVRNHVIPNDSLTSHLIFLTNQAAKEASYIAIGDSHTAYGIKASDTVHNLAYPGDNIIDMKYKVSRLTSNNAKVIIQADPHLFARYRLNSKFDYAKYLTPQNNNTLSLEILTPYHKSKLLHYWKSYLLKGELTSNNKLNSAYGGIVGEKKWSDLSDALQETRAKDRAAFHKPIKEFKTHTISKNYQEIIEILKTKKLDVCLVGFPVSKEYFFYMNSTLEYQNTLDFFKQLARDENIPFLSYSTTYANNHELFNDEDHLNDEGSAVFTAQVVKDCFGP